MRALLLLLVLSCPPLVRPFRASQASSDAESWMERAGVQLGFALDEGEELTQPRHFASKGGGCPIWLDPAEPPSGADVACPTCKCGMSFVLQYYCPPYVGEGDGHHRMIYVFVCPYEACVTKPASVRAFRCDREEGGDVDLSRGWGVGGRALQLRDEKLWQADGRVILSEQELDVGYPDEGGGEVLTPEEKAKIADLMARYEEDVKMHPDEHVAGNWEEEDAKADETEEDLLSARFKRVIASAPSQCVRLHGDGGAQPGEMREALWVCAEGRLKTEPPRCPMCNSKRRLEVEVLPQLLDRVDAPEDVKGVDVDWGNLVVFTCPKNCRKAPTVRGGGVYTEEYAWRQPGADRHLLPQWSELLSKVKSAPAVGQFSRHVAHSVGKAIKSS